MIVVLTTTADQEEAERIANGLVGEKLAACVQILPGVTSIYMWQGNVARDAECLLLIKTQRDLYTRLEKFIAANHSYDVPEIVAVSSEKVSDSYAKWLGDSLGGIEK